MTFYVDNRSGLGRSISYEVQRESLRSSGKTQNGLDKFIYFDTVPVLIKKTTENLIGTEGFWLSKINDMVTAYNSVTDLQVGLYIESLNINDGYFIIDGVEFFSGSIATADFGTVLPVSPPTEFRIVETRSASIAPSGYMPDTLKPFYSNNFAAEQLSRSSTMTLTAAQAMTALMPHPTNPDFLLTSANFSGLKEIAGIKYVDASLTYTIKVANISI